MRALTLVLTTLLLASCSFNPLYERRIHIQIEEQHPWHALSHKPMWKSLIYTDGTALRTAHLSSTSTSAEITVSRKGLVAVCAYPLGKGAPWGALVRAGMNNSITLTQREGALAHLFLEHWSVNPYALGVADLALLEASISDARLVDQMALVRSLCEGEKIEVLPLEPLSVSFRDLPEGRWVSEYSDGTSFYARWGEVQEVLAFDGVQRWLNKERSLCLSLTVDLPSKRSIWALHPAPLW